MIPAIDPGSGLTEDRPAPRAAPSGSPAFSQALKKASGREQAARQRSADDARAAGDTRAREQYGEAREARADRDAKAAREAREAREGRDDGERTRARDDRPVREGREARPITDKTPDAEQEAQEAKSDLQDAATKSAGTPLQPAQVQGEQLAQATDDAAVAALALQPTEDDPEAADFGVPDDATPIAAQIGTAAYRLGVHGKGEAQLAEAQGVVLPGTPQAEMLGKGVQDVRQAALQETEPTQFAMAVAGEAVADETDVLQVSEQAKAKEPKGLSHKEQIALQTAQTRNEVLSRLSATGGEEGALAGQTESGAGDALRQQLQLQGLLARNARSHALENTAQQAPQSVPAGLATPAGSVDLTQVFETPTDDAVEQRVLERVANEARWLLRNDRQEVTFRLQPEHLGSLHMKVMHKDGVFRVEMLVDNQAAKHMLESNLQDLRNRLAGDNPEGQFLFNVDVRQGNEQPSLYARPEQAAASGLARAEAPEQAPAPGMAGRVLGQSGLSIYV